jgi:hypothetical protein
MLAIMLLKASCPAADGVVADGELPVVEVVLGVDGFNPVGMDCPRPRLREQIYMIRKCLCENTKYAYSRI